MDSLKIEYIKATTTFGDISQATREAAIIALTERRTVLFTFNDKDYWVNPGDIVCSIVEQRL